MNVYPADNPSEITPEAAAEAAATGITRDRAEVILAI